MDFVQPGSILAGRYVLKSLLGAGGYGQVWQASDSMAQGQLVAVKVLDQPTSSRAPATHRADRGSPKHDELDTESMALRALRGLPHCLQLLNEERSPSVQRGPGAAPTPLPAGVRAMVTELAASDLLAVMIGVTSLVRQLAPPPGMDSSLLPLLPLDAPLRSQDPPTPAWHEGFARHFLLQAISGLQAAAGAGVFHRDVKLENFLIGAAGQLLLADFGLAHLATKGVQGGSTTVEEPILSTYCCGTSMYKAPEMLSGSLLQRQLGLWEPPSRRSSPPPRGAAGASGSSSSSHSSFTLAPPAGYDVRKVDTWSLGIVFLQLVSGGVPPWGHEGARLQSLGGAFYNFTKQPASILGVFRAPEDPPKVDGCAALSQMGRATLLHLLQASPLARPTVMQLSPEHMPHGVHEDVRTYLNRDTGRLGDEAVLQHLMAILPAVQQAARSTLAEVQRQRTERSAQRKAQAQTQAQVQGGVAGGPTQRQQVATTASNPSHGTAAQAYGGAAFTAGSASTLPTAGYSPSQAQLAVAGGAALPQSALHAAAAAGAGGGGVGGLQPPGHTAPQGTVPTAGAADVRPARFSGLFSARKGARMSVSTTGTEGATPLAPPAEPQPPTHPPIVGPSSTTEAPPAGRLASRDSLLHPLKSPPSNPTGTPPSTSSAAGGAAGSGATTAESKHVPKLPGQLDLLEKVVADDEGDLNEPPPSGPLRAPVYKRRGNANPLQNLAAAAAHGQQSPGVTVQPPARGALDFIPQGAVVFRIEQEHAAQGGAPGALAPVAAAVRRHLGQCEVQLQLDGASGAHAVAKFHESSSAPLQPVPWADEGDVCTSAVRVLLPPACIAGAAARAGAQLPQGGAAPQVQHLLEITWALQAREAAPGDAPWDGGDAAVLFWCAPCVSMEARPPSAHGCHVAALGCSGSLQRAIGALSVAASDAVASSGIAVGLSACLEAGIAAALAPAEGAEAPPSSASAVETGAAAGLRTWLERGGARQLALLAWQRAVAAALREAPPGVAAALPAAEAVGRLLARRAIAAVPHAIPASQQVHEVVPVLFHPASRAAKPGVGQVPPLQQAQAQSGQPAAEGDECPQGMLRLGSADSYSELM